MINKIKETFKETADKMECEFRTLGIEEIEEFFHNKDIGDKPIIILDPVEEFELGTDPGTAITFDIPVKLYFLTGFDATADKDDIKDKALGDMAKMAGDFVRTMTSPGDGTAVKNYSFDRDQTVNGTFIRIFTAHLLLGCSIEFTIKTSCNRN